MRSLGVLALVLLLGARAQASPDERSDRNRYYQLIPVAAGATVYLVLELGLKEQITPSECRWCRANALDRAVRDALVWDVVHGPDQLSNLTGYVGNPVYGIGMLILSSLDSDDTTRRWYDDAIPVLQAGIATGVINQSVKVLFGRSRPFVEFKGTSTRSKVDENTSFFSGHTSLAFAMAAASGTVASIRGYGTAPYIWGGGMLLATATGYFRIAADAHYFTDVLTGAVVGSAIGIAVPLLFHHDVLTDEATIPRTRGSDEPVMFQLYGGAF